MQGAQPQGSVALPKVLLPEPAPQARKEEGRQRRRQVSRLYFFFETMSGKLSKSLTAERKGFYSSDSSCSSEDFFFMRLLLVRHAQTIENAEERFQGHIHGRLSRLGIRQTRLLADALKKETIDYFFGSPLGRARETLEAVRINHPKIRAVFDDALMERGKGVWEEWLIADAVLKDPNVMKKMKKRDYRPENGESLNDLSGRVKPFLTRLEKIGNNKTALMVC